MQEFGTSCTLKRDFTSFRGDVKNVVVLSGAHHKVSCGQTTTFCWGFFLPYRFKILNLILAAQYVTIYGSIVLPKSRISGLLRQVHYFIHPVC